MFDNEDGSGEGTVDKALEQFNELLESYGVAASTVSDGTIVAFKLEKLLELAEIAEGNDNKKVIILIAKDLHHSIDNEEEDDTEFKN